MWLCGFKDYERGLFWKGDCFDTSHCVYKRADYVKKFVDTFSKRFEQVYSITDDQFNNYSFEFSSENIIKYGNRIK